MHGGEVNKGQYRSCPPLGRYEGNGKKNVIQSTQLYFSGALLESLICLTSGKLLESKAHFLDSFIASTRVNAEAIFKLCSLMCKPDEGSLFRKLKFQLRNSSSTQLIFSSLHQDQ